MLSLLRVFLFFLVSFYLSFPSIAQIKKAEWYYQSFQYAKSIKYFKKAINKPGNEEYLFDIADAYFHLKDYKNAQIYFKRYINEAPKQATQITLYDTLIVQPSGPDDLPQKQISTRQITEDHPKKKIAYLYLGECLMSNSLYDEAKIYFNLYFRTSPDDKRGKLFSKACDDVKIWSSMPAKYEVFSIPKLNSKYSDFSAVEYKDGIVFVSDRQEDVLNENADGYTQRPFLNMMIAKLRNPNDSLAFGRAKDFLTKYKGDYHTGPVCFNKDKTEIFISRVDEFKKRKAEKNPTHKPQLFTATFRNGKWTELTPFIHNNDQFIFAHPALSEDGKYLFFTSDMPGGYGGTDIWYCVRDNQTWSLPQNAGNEINTSGNESFPFFSNTNSLYFASDGHPGLGGLDIFSASFIDNTFSQPINLKANINSAYDDFAIYFKHDNKGGFFSSNRPGGVGKDDIYGFSVNTNIVNITGKILLTDNIKDGAESVKILLMTQEGKVLQTTTTDNTGFFKFENILADQFYLVKVDENDPLLRKQKKLYMADENNRIVRVTVVSEKGYFTFENIPPDLTLLDEINTDDLIIKSRLLNGFIVSGIDSMPLADVKIFLNAELGNVLQSRVTDKRGYFAFNNISSEQNYYLTLDENNVKIKTLNKILVKDKLGRIILTFIKNEKGQFNYHLLKTEQTDLALIDDEEPGINRSFKGKLYNAEDNSPIAGAQIILENMKNEILQTTLTDNLGNFRFFNVFTQQDLKININEKDPALYQVKKIKITDRDGHILYYAERKKDGFTFEILKSDPTFLAILEASDASVTTKKQFGGKILGDYKTPVVGAEVYMKDESGSVIGRTTTDSKGNFKFQNIPPDNNFLLALNENDPALQKFNTISIYDRKGKEVFKGGKFIGKFSFIVLKNDPTHLSMIEEVLDYGIKKRLSGKLINGDGSENPIANTEVWLLNSNGDLVDKTYTDAKGNFSFKNLSADETYLVTINPEDPNIKAIGRIILKDNKGNELFVSKKDVSGKFSFDILPSDKTLLSAMNTVDESLAKDMVGFLIAGDGDNAPIAGATIKLTNDNNIMVAKTTTANNGRFRFNQLRAEETYHVTIDENDPALKKYKNLILTDKNGKILYTSRIGKGGFKFDLIKNDATSLALLDNEDYTLERELKGYLFNEENGKAISGVKVFLTDAFQKPLNETKTNSTGFFKFSHLESNKNYLITLDENDPNLKNVNKVLIRDGTGKVILETNRNVGYDFKFNLIANDPTILSLLVEEDTRIKIDIEGLLLSDEKNKTPLPDILVELFDNNHEKLGQTYTNNLGYFKFKKQLADQNFIVEINPQSPGLEKYSSFILTDKSGKLIKRIIINKDGKFHFEILQTDQFALATLSGEDAPLAFLKQTKSEAPKPTTPINSLTEENSKSKNKESFTNNKSPKQEEANLIATFKDGQVIAQLYFTFGGATLTKEAKTELDKIIKSLKSNPEVYLIINGYADSRGSAEFNKKLSNRRRLAAINYLRQNGIKYSRIADGTAFGEENLENGCYDGVLCTEEQHAQNRKTEIISKFKRY